MQTLWKISWRRFALWLGVGLLLVGIAWTRAASFTPFEGYVLLNAACRAGDLPAVDILLRRGVSSDGRPDWARSTSEDRQGAIFVPPLAVAAQAGHVAVMQRLLKSGARVDQTDEDGRTPIVHAVIAKQLGAVTLLIAAGATLHDALLIDAVSVCPEPRIQQLFAFYELGGEMRWTSVDERGRKEYLTVIMAAVERSDLAWIASEISYPILVTSDDRQVKIETAKDFLRIAQPRFTDELKGKLLAASKEPLFTNWQGSMIGDGILWFEGLAPAGDELHSWRFRIRAFGGFAFQEPGEISGEPEPAADLVKPESRPPPSAAQLRAADLARTAGLFREIDAPRLEALGLYRIQAGDTFAKIARRFQVPIATLQEHNPGLTSSTLYIGQILRIAAPSER